MKATICLPALLTCMLLGATGSPPTASAEEHADLVRAAHAAAQRNDAAAILQKMRDLYRTLEWFSADGEATVRMKFMGAETTTSLAVSIKLGRPDRYLVSWGHRKGEVKGAPVPGESGDEIESAAWNAGAGAYVYARQFGAPAMTTRVPWRPASRREPPTPSRRSSSADRGRSPRSRPRDSREPRRSTARPAG